MSQYDLNGAGVIGLSNNVARLFVEVIVFGSGISTGMAIPTNYYGLGLLRLGRRGAYHPPIPIDAADQVIECPPGIDTLGYSLLTTTSIRVTEDFGA
jgi:hypothetical protein